MGHCYDHLESRRLEIQAKLDAAKSQRQRNKLGQFATPPALARDILRHADSLVSEHEKIRFLDPAVGTGSFYSALRSICPNGRVSAAVGIEIDRHYGGPALELWGDTGLDLRLADFTKKQPDAQYNLVICNPPYVRHHHIPNAEKTRLQRKSEAASGHRLGGLAGLYCHFLMQTHAWMSEGGIAGWLVPSEFMDVNYGAVVKRYLLESVTLLRIHRFDPVDVQFADALVSSAVVWIQKSPPPADHTVLFTSGGSLAAPRLDKTVDAGVLRNEPKWSRFPRCNSRKQTDGPVVGDLFKIRRGLATGHNAFFILTEDEVARRKLSKKFFRPVLPSPRYVSADVIGSDSDGSPLLDKRLFLLDVRVPEDRIMSEQPELWAYLEEGRLLGVHDRYLCRHRDPWYSQENRPAAPIVCTYLGRGDARSGRPFRFILNQSRATVANVYLAMYPKPALQRAIDKDPEVLRRVWMELNAIEPAEVLGQGRVYGGGLHKLEPKELANVVVPALADLAERQPAEELPLFADAEII